MQVAFFGTSEFAVPALRALAATTHKVGPVVAAAARPSGRGRKVVPSPVEQEARRLNLPVLTPRNPNGRAFIAELESQRPDVAVLAAYGYILKPGLLDLPRLGFLNIHPSLLPQYRGAAPIQRSILAGDRETGVTIISLSEQVDAGDIIVQEKASIGEDETAGDLSQRLAEVGARLATNALALLESGAAGRTPQDSAQATPAPKVTKDERDIDWAQPARQIHNRIRALSPEPGAVTSFRGKRVVLLRSRVSPLPERGGPGEVLVRQPGLIIAAGSGLLEITELKPEGKSIQTGRDFCNGSRPEGGDRFGA
ncbi:methionyl-tRNA formyltransferase [candidate division WOR-3 bacterium]|nr:methionyl-tRNA formyltransferase [candidate division WOR-3 bacterium]